MAGNGSRSRWPLTGWPTGVGGPLIDTLIALMPADPGPVPAALLVLAATAGAFLTTAAGIGGGVFLLAVMTAFLPVGVLIPLHGAVQAAANGWRMLLFLRSVRWPVIGAFTLGCVAGAGAGSQLLVQVPTAWLELVLAIFVLCAVWGPRPRLPGGGHGFTAAGGVVTGALTLFLGATGPLVSAVMAGRKFDRFVYMATFSTCMVVQHALKLLVFGLLGFALGDYLPLLAAMMAGTLIGTICGRHVLGRLDEHLFRRLLAILLTLLALRLAWSGIEGLAAGA